MASKLVPSSIVRRIGAHPRRFRLAVVAAAIAVAGLTPLASSATPAGDGNPDLGATCGLDVTLVLDNSNSISSGEANDVRSAAALFASALDGTPSRLKTVVFSTRATGVSTSGSLTSNLANVAFRDPGDYSAPTSGSGSGGTNWDDGLEVARRSSGGPGDLVVFITDGDPTYHNSTQPDGHANDGSHSISGSGSSVSSSDLSAAVQEADAIKGLGAHLFGIGVGLSGSASKQRLNDVTGDEELTLSGGTPNIPFGTADFTIAPNFSDLQGIVSAFVRELCAPSLNVTKHLQNADGSTSLATSADPFTFTAAVSPTPSSWTTPAGASGASATQATDSSGGVSFKWAMSANSATVDLTEAAKAGWVYNGAICTRNLLQGDPPTVIFNSVGQNQPGASKDPAELEGLHVGIDEAVNCDVFNRQIRAATIQVAKQTLPAGLSDQFAFTLARGGSTVDTLSGVSHGQTATFQPVAPGTYAVVETANPNFDQTSARCDDLGTQQIETVAASALTVAEGQNWRCTFLNTAHPGTIKVTKAAQGADGTFSFASNIPDLGNFSLTTSGGTASTMTITVPVGTYAVAEDAAAPWTLKGATCTGQQQPGSVFVGPGAAVTCTFTNVAPDPTITVSKVAGASSVGEPGGPVPFTVTVTNTSVEPVTITHLTDSIAGGPALDITSTGGAITATDCDGLIGTTLTMTGPGASASCSFTATVSGNGGETVDDVVRAKAVDASENEATDTDGASVAITKVPPTISVTKTPSVSSLAEPGGDVTYTVAVTNTGGEPVVIDSVVDAIEGGAPLDVTAVAPPVSATTCGALIGASVAPGASKSCAFTIAHVVNRADFADGVMDDTVTVSGHDDDAKVTETASAEVTITDTKPTVELTKTAVPSSVAETAPGQTRPVAYTLAIQNTSAEPVTIDSLTDSVEGGTPFSVGGTCAALIHTALAPGAGTTCSFTLGVSGNAGETVDDLATISVSDDDGNHVGDADGASVAITGLASSIQVDKTASVGSVPEPGGDVTYTVDITNTSAADTVTIGSVVDSVEGATASAVGGTCAGLIGTSLVPGASTSCTFPMPVAGNAGAVVHDTVTVTGTDDDGGSVSDTGDEAVAITDVPSSISVEKTASTASVTEPGAGVTYTVKITNTSTADAVTIDSIADAVADGPSTPVAGTCAGLIGTSLAPGASTTCTFTMTVSGNAGDAVRDTVTVSGTDDDEASVSASDSAVVDIADAASAIAVTKTPSVGSLPEPGGEVTYTVKITNTSTADAVTIDSIADAVADGPSTPVAGTCAALVGTTLTPGGSATCAFTLAVTGNAGDVVGDTVTVSGTDDDAAPVSATASAVVDITDVLPTGTVSKTADPSTLPEPGGQATFTVVATNTSTVEPETVTAITDLVDGSAVDVTTVGGPVTATTCATGAVLAPGASYTCTFTLAITGADAGDVVVDQVAVTLADDEHNTTTPTDTESVTITDVLPSITVTKDNGGATVTAPGADVAFDVTVTNTSVEPVLLQQLTDTVEGGDPFDITTTSGPVVTTDCATGGSIAPGDTYACSFTLAVASNEAATQVDVVDAVAVDDEGNPATAGDDAVTAIAASADLAIHKSVTGEPFEVGGTGTYAIEVTNHGPSTATGITVTDAVPAGLAPTGAAGDGWACAITGQDVSCQRPSLASGESSTVTLTVTVGEALAGASVTNVARVAAETDDPNLADNEDQVATDVPAVAPDEVTSTTAPATTTTPPAVAPQDQTAAGPLARTGSDVVGPVLLGLALAAVGALVLGGRRRLLRRS